MRNEAGEKEQKGGRQPRTNGKNDKTKSTETMEEGVKHREHERDGERWREMAGRRGERIAHNHTKRYGCFELSQVLSVSKKKKKCWMCWMVFRVFKYVKETVFVALVVTVALPKKKPENIIY